MKTCPTCGEKFPDDANFCPMDAQKLVAVAPTASPAAPAAAAAAPGLINGRFALGPTLGGGASGEVFRAKDQQTHAQVAVKLINPAVLPSPIAVERASRELRQLARVQSERIARIIDFGKTQDGRLYVATDFVEGESLDKIVAKNGPLSLGRARNLTLQIGEALTEAQKAGVIHRDVSPKNVLVTAGDKVRLINFSMPRPVTDKIFGVPEFLSPEQAEGRSVDQRSNIYSLGAILYYLASGKPPFEGADAKAVCEMHLKGQVALPSTKKAGLPADLDRLVAKALEKSSSRRHLTLRQLLSEIEALAADGAQAPDQARAHTMYAAGGVPQGAAPHHPSAHPALTHPAAAAPPPRQVTSPVAVAQTMMAPATAQMAPVSPTPAPAPAPRISVAQAGSIGGGEAPSKTVSTSSAPPPAAANPPPAGQPGKGAAFRETLWFKKGEVDQFMQQQAAKPGQPAPEAPAEDIRPIEDRYKDDGSVSAQDREKFSLRTGQTMFGQRVQIPSGAAVPGERMSEDEMMAEIHSGRRVGLWVALVLLVAAAAAAWFLFGRNRGSPKAQAPAAPPPVAAAPAPVPAATPPPTPPPAPPAEEKPAEPAVAASPDPEPPPKPAKKKHSSSSKKRKKKTRGW